jgi:hypothetical protein
MTAIRMNSSGRLSFCIRTEYNPPIAATAASSTHFQLYGAILFRRQRLTARRHSETRLLESWTLCERQFASKVNLKHHIGPFRQLRVNG